MLKGLLGKHHKGKTASALDHILLQAVKLTELYIELDLRIRIRENYLRRFHHWDHPKTATLPGHVMKRWFSSESHNRYLHVKPQPSTVHSAPAKGLSAASVLVLLGTRQTGLMKFVYVIPGASTWVEKKDTVCYVWKMLKFMFILQNSRNISACNATSVSQWSHCQGSHPTNIAFNSLKPFDVSKKLCKIIRVVKKTYLFVVYQYNILGIFWLHWSRPSFTTK